MPIQRAILIKHGTKTWCWEAWWLRLNDTHDILNPDWLVPEVAYSLSNLAFVDLLPVPHEDSWIN